MKFGLKEIAVIAAIGLLALQNWMLQGELRRSQEQQSRSVEVLSQRTADAIKEVGRAVSLVGQFGERTAVIRTSPTEVRVVTDRPGRDGAPGAPGTPGTPGRDGSIVQPRPDQPREPGAPGGTRPPSAITPPDKTDEARARARIVLRQHFDPGTLNCPGNPTGNDSIETYIFADGLGTTAPCVRRLEADVKTNQQPLVTAQQSRFKVGFSTAGPLLAYEVASLSVPLLGKFNLDALAVYRSELYLGAGLSRDITDRWSLGIGYVQQLRLDSSGTLLIYGTHRF